MACVDLRIEEFVNVASICSRGVCFSSLFSMAKYDVSFAGESCRNKNKFPDPFNSFNKGGHSYKQGIQCILALKNNFYFTEVQKLWRYLNATRYALYTVTSRCARVPSAMFKYVQPICRNCRKMILTSAVSGKVPTIVLTHGLYNNHNSFKERLSRKSTIFVMLSFVYTRFF